VKHPIYNYEAHIQERREISHGWVKEVSKEHERMREEHRKTMRTSRKAKWER
jgi:hypothetical protein